MAQKILIVDDSKVMRSIIKKEMEKAGYGKHTYFEAGNASEAISAIAANKPDLVLTDLYMPGDTGIDLIEKIKSRGFQCKVGFITSETHPSMHQAAKDMGALFVLTKPVTADGLKKALARVL